MCQLDYQETGIYKEATIVGLDRHDAADHEFCSNGDIKINKISAEDHKLQRFDTNIKLKESTVSMPEDSHNNHKEINTIPTNGIKICGIFVPPKAGKNRIHLRI